MRKDHPPCKSFHEHADHKPSRRDFLKAAGITTAGVLVHGCSKSVNGPENSIPKTKQPIPGSVQGTSQVAKATLTNYDPAALKSSIQSSFEAIGGISDIIKSGDTVGIKLNMTGGQYNAAKCNRTYGLDATELYWTHPEILRAVGELLKDAGAGKIYVMEANYDWPSVTDWGYLDVTTALGGEYIDLNDPDPYDDFLAVDVQDPLTHWASYYHHPLLHEVDCFVQLPKFKRHVGGGVTGAMKMMIGSTPLAKYKGSGDWREKLHSTDTLQNSNSYEGFKNLVRTIVDLNRIRPGHLTVTDAILTAQNGEGTWISGFEPLALNTLITSKDLVAADAVGTLLFGFDPTSADREGPFAPDSLPASFAGTDNYLRIAEEMGLGNHDPANIEQIDATISMAV